MSDRRTLFIVFALHGLIIGMCTFKHTKAPPIAKKIQINTLYEKELPKVVVKKTTPPPKKIEEPSQPVVEPVFAKIEKLPEKLEEPIIEAPQAEDPPAQPIKPVIVITEGKKPAPKKPVPQKKPKTAASNSVAPNKNKNKEALALAKKGLQSLNSSSKTLTNGTKKPNAPSYPTGNRVSAIGKLESESLEFTSVEFSYAEELAIFLKHKLHFPEAGTMKISLTLDRDGKMQSFNIQSSTSEKNREIAKKSQSIVFPPFRDRFKGEKIKTFALHLNIEGG